MPELTAAFFAYAAGLDAYQIAMGLIISLVLGFSAGNYACSLVHRLPRGLGVLDKKPYCGSCNTMLQTKDLFPVFSALLLNHKCRYCGGAIPKTHFYTELALGALFCLAFTQFGFGERYVLLVLLGSMLTVLSSIHHNEKQIDRRVLLAVLITGLLLRTLVDASIFPALQAGLYGAIIAALLWRKQIRKVGHIYVLPDHALVFITGTIAAGMWGLPAYLLLYLALWAIFKLFNHPITYTLSFSLALIASLFMY